MLTEHDYQNWDNFIEKSNAVLPYHSTKWLRVLKNTYTHKPIYLFSKNRDRINGILPLFQVKIPFYGKILASGVFTSYAGVCSDSKAVDSELMSEAALWAERINALYLEVKNSRRVTISNSEWNKKTDFCTMILDLNDGADKVWSNWRQKSRTDVRKAQKSNIIIEFGNQYLDDFYEVISLNMRGLGTPVHSKKLYLNILHEFPDNAKIFVAKYEGNTICAVLTIEFKDTIYAHAMGQIYKYRALKPSALIYWRIIQYASEKGYKALDFGRSAWNSGTFNFKKHLGAEPQQLHYDYYLNRINEVPHIYQDNTKFAIPRKLWRVLPISLTKILGPHFIKYVV